MVTVYHKMSNKSGEDGTILWHKKTVFSSLDIEVFLVKLYNNIIPFSLKTQQLSK